MKDQWIAWMRELSSRGSMWVAGGVTGLLGGCGWVAPGEPEVWRSARMEVRLVAAVPDDEQEDQAADLEYAIRFPDGVSFRVPSFLHAEGVEESFRERRGFFGSSGVFFSRSGSTVVIKDDTPSAASSDGHQLIVARDRGERVVATLMGPERPGQVIEEWPQVVRVTDEQVVFRYDGEEKPFAISIDGLLREGKRIGEWGEDRR